MTDSQNPQDNQFGEQRPVGHPDKRATDHGLHDHVAHTEAPESGGDVHVGGVSLLVGVLARNR